MNEVIVKQTGIHWAFLKILFHKMGMFKMINLDLQLIVFIWFNILQLRTALTFNDQNVNFKRLINLQKTLLSERPTKKILTSKPTIKFQN